MDQTSSIGFGINLLMAVIYFIYWISTFVILYHLTRFGIGVQPKRFAAVFFLGSIILFCASLIIFINIDVSSLL